MSKYHQHQPPLPPRWADRLLEYCCAPHLLEEVQGDLHELYGKWVEKHGERKANWLYIFHTIKFFRPFAIKRKKYVYPLNSTAMIRNYFKISLRHLWRQKGFSFINITGLSLGLACCMLIFLYTKDEISFDRFHEKRDQIYQLTYTFLNLDTNEKNAISHTGISAGEGFERDIPEVESIVRIKGSEGLVRQGTEVIQESLLYAEHNFFSVFSFPLIAGDAQTALQNLESIVLTEDAAEKYFGTTDVIGKELQININQQDFETFVVSAVAENPPQNSSIRFNVLLPFALYKKSRAVRAEDWFAGYLTTFIILHPQADPVAVEAKFAEVLQKHAGDLLQLLSKEYNVNAKITYGLQPLTDIHLSTTFGTGDAMQQASNPIYSYLMSALACFILLIACFNFVNLSVAQSMRRGKEIGIRKVAGSNRKQLVKQFLGESFLVCLLAFTLALLLTELALPLFNELANKKLNFSYLTDAYLIGGYVLLLVLTALSAGSYPAWVLSGFNPIQTLYGRQKLTGKHAFAKSLVVLQFALATLLIIGTFTVYSQIDYLLTRDLGYDDENLVRISLMRDDKHQAELLKNELKKSSDIVDVTINSGGSNYTLIRTEGNDLAAYDTKIDENYLSVLDIPVIEGRGFSPQFPGDSTQSVIINETFAREAGWGEHPIGKTLTMPEESDHQYVVVGMVKDYNFNSLREKIKPLVLHLMPKRNYGEVLVKIRPDHLPETMAFLEKTYKQIEPLYPFDYRFVDVENARQYQAEQRWKQVMTLAAFLAVLISCIGLLGLAALAIQQRTKEIGIRKVLGASLTGIVALLSKDFIKLVVIAFFIAVPIGYYAAELWLQNFTYRIEMGWWIFVIVGIVSFIIALFTISFQSIKAALMNPVDSLRNE